MLNNFLRQVLISVRKPTYARRALIGCLRRSPPRIQMPAPQFEPDQRLWLLHTPSTSYAVRLDEDDNLRHVHWGTALTLAQARELAERTPPAGSSFDTAGGPEELAAEGGARFGVPGLQVRFADGTRGVEWRCTGHDADGGHLRIHLEDRHYPLRVTLHYRVHEDSDVIERWTTVENRDPREAIAVQRCDSAAWTLPPGED